MTGISSKALKPNYADNKYKFNGIELNNHFDLNMYDAFYRNLDPQIGRFWQIDPKAVDEVSPYVSMLNNPITHFDPLGDTTLYYDVDGNLLYQTNVAGYRNAFIINNENLDAAKQFFSLVGSDLGSIGQFLLDAAFYVGNGNGELGDVYDLHSISKFYEDYEAKGEIHRLDGIKVDDMDYLTIDGKRVSADYIKSLQGAEHTVLLVKEAGVWRVRADMISTNNDLTRSPGVFQDPHAHIHNYIPQLLGKSIGYQLGKTHGFIGPIIKSQIPSGKLGDVGIAKDEGKIGGTRKNIVVNYSHIWFYDGRSTGFQLNRK